MILEPVNCVTSFTVFKSPFFPHQNGNDQEVFLIFGQNGLALYIPHQNCNGQQECSNVSEKFLIPLSHNKFCSYKTEMAIRLSNFGKRFSITTCHNQFCPYQKWNGGQVC